MLILVSDAALTNTTASNNTAVGYDALKANVTGTANTAVGKDALLANLGDAQNTAVGLEKLLTANTTGTLWNTAFRCRCCNS